MVAAMLSNDVDQVLAMYADDCQVLDPAMEAQGKSGLATAVTYFFAAFKMLGMTIDETVITPDTLIIRSHWSALHHGEYLGVPASGRVFHTWNIMWLKLKDELIISDNSIWDAGELRRLEALGKETENPF